MKEMNIFFQVSPAGNAVEFCWRSLAVSSRVATLAVFASGNPEELFILGGAHWALMFVWLVTQVRRYE